MIFKFPYLCPFLLMMAAPVFGQLSIQDTDGDGLADSEELRYGLSPYLADTNLNGRPDLQQIQQWDVAFPADQSAWTAEWTPEAVGTYRFTINSVEPIRFKVNDAEITPYSGNTYEVIGFLSEKVNLSIERTNVGGTPASDTILTASFIDGMDADGDGLSLDWEMTLHTDPAKTDTDGDGLSDGDEVMKYGTDPLSGDSNHNGLPDYVEVLTLPASQMLESEGFWEEKMDSMAARNPSKALLYRMPLPYAGNYRLGVVTHPDSTASGTLKFYVDGTLQGETTLQPGSDKLYHWIDVNVTQPVNASTGRPSLSHLIRVEWENKTPGANPGELLLQQIYIDYIDDTDAPVLGGALP